MTDKNNKEKVMSYEIIQSTKVYRVTDGDNEIYISGVVAESNNVRPQRFDRIYFYGAGLNKNEALYESASLAETVLSGSFQLKNGDNNIEISDADTMIRRYTRNVNKAKLVQASKIEIHSKSVTIHFGESGMQQLKSYEPKFYISCANGNSLEVSRLFNEEKSELFEEAKRAYAFLNGERTIDEAIAFTAENGILPVLFSSNQIVTHEQFKTLLGKLNPYYTGTLYTKPFLISDCDLAIMLAKKVIERSTRYTHPTRYLANHLTSFLENRCGSQVMDSEELARLVVSLEEGGQYLKLFSERIQLSVELSVKAMRHGMCFTKLHPAFRTNDAAVQKLACSIPWLYIPPESLSVNLQKLIADDNAFEYLRAKQRCDEMSTLLPEKQSRPQMRHKI